jgi:hypothetical protein
MPKICIKCHQEKDESEFYSYSGRCKKCYNEYGKLYKLKNKKRILKRRKIYNFLHKKDKKEYNKKYSIDYYSRYKTRMLVWKKNANKRNIEWNITLEEIQAMPLVCHYTGAELTLEPNKSNTISLDRIDSSKGYTKDNVVFCLVDINKMKRDYSKRYFLDLCQKISSHFNKK